MNIINPKNRNHDNNYTIHTALFAIKRRLKPMISKVKTGYCKGETCPNKGKETLIISGLCAPCHRTRFKNYGKKKQLKKKPLKKKFKSSGEAALFRELWKTRPHISFISFEPLPKFNIMQCFHVLPKGSYPGYRLNPENIIFTTVREHELWHSISRTDLLKLDPRWQNVFDLYEKLQKQYHEERQIPKFD